MREALARAYSIAAAHTLFMIGQTRVHLDRVENLGDWIEKSSSKRMNRRRQE